MSKICQITGKKAIVGNNVSHSKRRTKRKFNVNLFNKKFYWVEQGVWISLTISAAAAWGVWLAFLALTVWVVQKNSGKGRRSVV